MNQREEEFQQKSQELDILIDDVEPKIRELSIGEINQAVCGAYTEDCDEVCGGAQCLTSNGKVKSLSKINFIENSSNTAETPTMTFSTEAHE